MARNRILLIEDDPDYEKLICHVLTTAANPFDIKSAANLGDGLALLDQHSPELILVDLTLPDSFGYETFLRVRERAHGAPIIVLTGLDDDQVAIQAVEDGAADYLVKTQMQTRNIVRSVQMAFSRRRRQENLYQLADGEGPASVLSFIGSKGGVGTSTTAVNVGALLAQNGFETVVIELQTGCPGTLALYSASEPRPGLTSLIEKSPAAITPADLEQCLAEAGPNLRLLRSAQLCEASVSRVWSILDRDHVHAIIAAARRVCRFVVLDLPSRIDEGIAEALRLSDSITLLVDREAASIQCAAAVLEQIEVVAEDETEVRVAAIDRTALESPLSMDDIKQQLRVHPSVMIPAASAAIALSHAARTPLVLLYPGAAYSLAHFDLTERLLPPSIGVSRRLSGPGLQLSRKVAWGAIPETIYG
jgi:DNA-binding response OmpR family regulator